MLQSMRHLAQSWLFKGLMILLVVSFGIWGIGDMFRGNALKRTVAKAGSVAISVQELNQEFERNLAQARRSFGPELTAQQAKQIGILDMTLNNLIQRAQIDQETARLGIVIDNNAVLDVLASIPQFQGKDGKLDKDRLRLMLEKSNKNEQDFFEQGRRDTTRHELLDIFQSSNPVPHTVIDLMSKVRGQKRLLDIVLLKNSGINDIPTPDEKALHDFYQQAGKSFITPEYRGITIAQLSLDDIAKDIAVSDDDVKKEYEAQSATLAHDEQRELLQVLIQDEAKAKQVSAAAQVSGSLATAAKAAGYEAVPLGESDKRSLLPELAGPVFALKPGGISEPIKSNLGWHVMQVTKIIPAGKPSFEAMKDKLRSTLQHDQAIDTATRMVNQLDDDLAAGKALEDVAGSMKLHLTKIPALDANGKTPDGKEYPDLPHKADALKTAFGQNSGDVSPVMDDKNGNYFVVRTDDVTPSAVKPFDKAHDEIVAAWKAHEQEIRAKALSEKIAQGLRDGKAVSSFADKGGGVETYTSQPVSQMDNKVADIPQSLMPEILALKKGDVIARSLTGQQLIVRVASVAEADEKDSMMAKGQVTDQLKQQLPKEFEAQYIKHLNTLFPSDIRQDTLDTVLQQPGG